jgi:hypothetical protein
VRARSLTEVTSFIEQARLPQSAFPGRTRAAISPEESALATQAGRYKAAVCGGEILSFSNEVPPDRRTAILNCALLAQLVAKDRVPDASRLDEWYDAYFDSLTNLGWAIAQRSWSTSKASGEEFSAHRAVLTLVASFLGEATSAYLLVRDTLDALRSLDSRKDSWLKLFDRETHCLRSAKFQIGVVSGDAANLNIASMSFKLESSTTVSGVLFFKAKDAEVTFRETRNNTAVNAAILDQIGPLIQEKLVTHVTDYIRGLPQLK